MKKELGQSQPNQFLTKNTNPQSANITSPNLPGFLQIKNWVGQLNSKKMLRGLRNDILNILQQLGSEGNQYLLECLLESLDLNGQSQQSKNALHTTVKGQFLSQHLHDLIYSNTSSNFADFLPQVFIKVVCGPNSNTNTMNANKINLVTNYVQDIIKYLKISIVDQLFIALTLSYSNNDIVAQDGVKLLKEKIIDYLQQSNPQLLPQNNLPTLLLQMVLQNQELKGMTAEIQQLKQLVNDSKNKEMKPLIYGKEIHEDRISQGSDDLQDPDLHKESNYFKPDDISNIVGPADILKELGPNSTTSMENLIRSFQNFQKWSNTDVYLTLEVIAQDPSTYGEESSQRLANNIYQVESKNCNYLHLFQNCQQEWSSFTNQEQADKNIQEEWNVDIFIEFLIKKVFSQNNELNTKNISFKPNIYEKINCLYYNKYFKQINKIQNNSFEKNNKNTLNKCSQSYLFHIFYKDCTQIQWNSVIQEVDRPDMKLSDEKTFKQFFLNLQLINKKSPFQMPNNIFIKRWKYGKSQTAFLRSMLTIGSTELVRWNEIQKTPMNLDFNVNYKYGSLQPQALQFWACLEILDLLLDLSEGDNYMAIHDIFETPINKYPDILIVGLSQLTPKRGSNLLDELFSQLFPFYLSNHANSVQILEAIWKNRDDLLISAICELYKKEIKKENTTLNLSRVLDITQYIKDSLIALTNCNDYSFSIALGILAGKREFLHFDQWLNERVKNVGDPFVNALLAYLDENIIFPIKEIQTKGNASNPNTLQQLQEGVLEKAQITIEILTIIFETLLVEQSPEKLSSKNRQKLQEQYKEILQFFPKLSGSNDSPGQGTEKKANYNFQRFYSKEVSLEEMTVNLKQLMNSNSSEDREVFACMITSLIEEAKYHAQYPITELLLTGQLQGSIIATGLVNQKPLGILLEQILESSKRSQRQVEFAVKAIEQMKDRLYEFPNFVNALFDSSCHLSEQYPHLLIQIYNLLNEKKVKMNVNNKQIEYLKQKVEQLKNDSQKPLQAGVQNQQPNKRVQQSGQNVAQEQITVNLQSAQPQQQSQQLQQPQLNSTVSEPSQIISSSTVPKNQTESIKNNEQTSLQKPGSINYLAKPPEEKQASDNTISNPVKKKLKNTTKVFELPSNLGIDISNLQSQATANTAQQPSQSKESVLTSGGQQQQYISNKYEEGIYGQIGFPSSVGQTSVGSIGHNGYTSGVNPGSIGQSSNQIIIGSGNQVIGQGGTSQQYEQNISGGSNIDEQLKSKPYQGGVGFIQRPVFANGEFQQYTQKKLTEIRDHEDNLQIEDRIRNKVVFALNNLSETNLEKHQNDLRNFVENGNFLRWFASYLVLWRATLKSESNIILITKLVEKIDKPKLFNYIVKDSLLLLHKFLLSELDIQPTDRNMLKCLGQWIGMFTLNRNKSINSKYLNIKALIVNSYPNRVDIIIPIVINILLCSKDSKVFNPQTNRWIRRIFSLLEEFKNALQKDTVKHQINQLFSILQVDINSLETCTYFRYYLNEIKKADKTATTIQQHTNIIERLIISDELTNIVKNFDLKQAVFLSLDEAIKEIIQPVISRSVTIALITTRELTLKDYCTDPDENNLLNGIQSMVQKLSGSLALITCKDPLRSSFQTHLKTHLERVSELNNNEKEQLINRVVNDNLDTGCSEIRQRVMDQALKDIRNDEQIIEACEMRRVARERQQIFVDDKYYKFAKNLPLLLQPKIPSSFCNNFFQQSKQ